MTEKTTRRNGKWAKVSGRRGRWCAARGWQGDTTAAYVSITKTKLHAEAITSGWLDDK